MQEKEFRIDFRAEDREASRFSDSLRDLEGYSYGAESFEVYQWDLFSSTYEEITSKQLMAAWSTKKGF